MERAEDSFHQSLTIAHRQGALSSELRTTTSLARLLRDLGRPADLLALLQQVYDRFTEGVRHGRPQNGKSLLGALQSWVS
jgi:predicted ATPase